MRLDGCDCLVGYTKLRVFSFFLFVCNFDQDQLIENINYCLKHILVIYMFKSDKVDNKIEAMTQKYTLSKKKG